MTRNPYESSHVVEPPAKPTGALAASPWRELIVVLLAAFCFLARDCLGRPSSRTFPSSGPGEWIGETGIALMIWFHWGGKIVGRLGCDLAAGFLLGRYLRRVNPIHAVAAFMALPIGILLLNPAARESWGLPIRYVGLGGAALQLVVQLATMFRYC